jgi:hypothetical protein
MDQFCISDNESGGSCVCSSSYGQYESKLKQIEKNTDEANRRSTIEVEKIKAGSNADILFTGTREYDKAGNVSSIENQKDAKKRARQASIEAMMSDGDEEEEEDETISEFSMEGLTGKNLYDGARNICLEQVADVCGSTLVMQTQRYLAQIKNDCIALSKSLDDLLKKSELAILDADKEMVAARQEVNNEVNKYNRGQCMVEFKKCMMTEDACGPDWGRCAGSVAAENMQNNAAKSVRGTKVAHVGRFDLTDSTMEMLESKRNICEGILDQCQAARAEVWPDFLRDIAPELKVAESKLESVKRQSCLTDISGCIQKACKDDIAGKGAETMDSCLARPEMARSFCKVEIDPCERMEPQIWDYVVSKLAAMRIDACTNEVKECFTSEDRCGPDFGQCIGMDYKYLHEMCPVDKLVVCKQANRNFQMSDIDNMLLGFYLNVDNSALDFCQERIDEKMTEVCGSTTDCDRFAADNNLGIGSLQSVKDADIYRITGMLSFGMIKMGDGETCDGVEDGGKCDKAHLLPYGSIGIKDYIKEIRSKNFGGNTELVEAILDSIEMELRNIEGTINRTADILESDQEISFCIKGRDLSQINGKSGKNNKTTARFPNLLNNTKQLIAVSALRRAQDNYNKKYTEYLTKAVKEASADIAQVVCHQMGSGLSMGGKADAEVGLIPPYAIMIEVGRGVGLNGLLAGNTASSTHGASASTKDTMAGISLSSIGYKSSGTQANGNVTTKTRALFTRETRNCHFCSQVSTVSCSSSSSSGFLGIGAKSSSSCKTNAEPERCEDVMM